MKEVERLRQMQDPREACDVSSGDKRYSTNQTTRKKRPKRKCSSLSYVEAISYAILHSPLKRVTLSEIYEFIQNNYPSFTQNRVRWKNTVRHNLSRHECFQRGEIAMHKARCYWRIHPSFLAEFSHGDFSRRKLRPNPPLSQEGTGNLVHNHSTIQSPFFPGYTYNSNPPFPVQSFGSLHFNQGGIPTVYDQHFCLPWHHCILNGTPFS